VSNRQNWSYAQGSLNKETRPAEIVEKEQTIKEASGVTLNIKRQWGGVGSERLRHRMYHGERKQCRKTKRKIAEKVIGDTEKNLGESAVNRSSKGEGRRTTTKVRRRGAHAKKLGYRAHTAKVGTQLQPKCGVSQKVCC